MADVERDASVFSGFDEDGSLKFSSSKLNDGVYRPNIDQALLQLAKIPFDFKTTTSDQRVAWVLRHLSTIELTSSVLDIPATAIAAAPDEEYRTHMAFKDDTGDQLALMNLYNTANEFHTDPETMLEKIFEQDLPDVQSGRFNRDATDIVKMDIGNGNINFGNAILALNGYLSSYKDDPLGLAVYKGNYLQLAHDLMSKDSDVTFKISGLLLKQVDDFYVKSNNVEYQNAIGTVRQDEMLDNGYRFGISRLQSYYIPQGIAPPPRSGEVNYLRSEYFQIRAAIRTYSGIGDRI
jgi:hypothetical protein